MAFCISGAFAISFRYTKMVLVQQFVVPNRQAALVATTFFTDSNSLNIMIDPIYRLQSRGNFHWFRWTKWSRIVGVRQVLAWAGEQGDNGVWLFFSTQLPIS